MAGLIGYSGYSYFRCHATNFERDCMTAFISKDIYDLKRERYRFASKYKRTCGPLLPRRSEFLFPS